MASNSTDKDLSAAGTHIGQSLDQLRADIAALSETVARLASEGADSAKSQIPRLGGPCGSRGQCSGRTTLPGRRCSGAGCRKNSAHRYS